MRNEKAARFFGQPRQCSFMSFALAEGSDLAGREIDRIRSQRSEDAASPTSLKKFFTLASPLPLQKGGQIPQLQLLCPTTIISDKIHGKHHDLLNISASNFF